MIKIKQVRLTEYNQYRCFNCGTIQSFFSAVPYECSSCRAFQPNISRLFDNVGVRVEYHLSGMVDGKIITHSTDIR